MKKRIKVLYVLPFGSIGGAEKFVLSLCHHHNKKKFEVFVCILFSEGTISNKIYQQSIRVKVLDMFNGFDIIRASKLINFIRSNKIDIVNIHGQNPLGKLFAALSLPSVMIQTDHGTTIGSPIKRKKRVILANRIMRPVFDRYIAISNGMEESLKTREKVPKHKIVKIYNGIEVEKFAKQTEIKIIKALFKELGIKEKIPIIGTVSRLAPEKQIHLLLDSLSHIKKSGQRFICLIIGEGPEKSKLESISETLNLKKNVLFIGERSDIAQLLDIVNIFVMSSGGEAFSITVLEAMAKSLPIVAYDVEGINEAILNGKTGYLVPFGDTVLFAKRIIEMISDPLKSKVMGQEGFKRVKKEFDILNNIKKLELLYQEIILFKN